MALLGITGSLLTDGKNTDVLNYFLKSVLFFIRGERCFGMESLRLFPY
jgi:hypothetical protein